MDIDMNTHDFEYEDKDKRVAKERKRLRKLYEEMSGEVSTAVEGLIDRAAYMRVTIEEMEIDITYNGRVKPFQQSPDLPAYERERPVIKQYTTWVAQYRSIISLIVKTLPAGSVSEPDAFDVYMSGGRSDTT